MNTRTSPMMITSLVVLVAGLVIGFLGVGSAVSSYQREQGLKEYSQAFTRGTYVSEVGVKAGEAASKLASFDDQRTEVFRDAMRAFLGSNVARYNDLVNKQNALARKGNGLMAELSMLVDALAKE